MSALPVKVVRRDGWDVRLRELVDGARDRRFAYGVHDCCTFAMLELPRALSGEDFSGRIGMEWTNDAEAFALLEETPLDAMVARAFGEPVENWKLARRGDIGLVDPGRHTGNLPLLAVVLGAMCAAPGELRLEFVKTSHLSKVWRLG